MNEMVNVEDAQIERLEFFKHPNNGFSYLVHQTKDAQNKYQYPISEIISNFDFAKKLENIRKTSRAKPK